MPSRKPPAPLPDSLAPQQPEYRAPAFAPWESPPVPLAANARVLQRHAGPCGICHRALLTGERAADLPDGGGIVHVTCASRAAR